MTEKKGNKPGKEKVDTRKPVVYNWREKLKSREEMLKYLQAAEK